MCYLTVPHTQTFLLREKEKDSGRGEAEGKRTHVDYFRNNLKNELPSLFPHASANFVEVYGLKGTQYCQAQCFLFPNRQQMF